MKNSFSILRFILLVTILLNSCAFFQNDFKYNYSKSQKTFDKLYKENGNVFMVSSIYSNFSYVWSYKNEELTGFIILKGKIHKSFTINKNQPIWLTDFPKNTGLDIFGCLTWHASELNIKINLIEGEKTDEYFALDFNCFLKAPGKNYTFNEIAYDFLLLFSETESYKML